MRETTSSLVCEVPCPKEAADSFAVQLYQSDLTQKLSCPQEHLRQARGVAEEKNLGRQPTFSRGRAYCISPARERCSNTRSSRVDCSIKWLISEYIGGSVVFRVKQVNWDHPMSPIVLSGALRLRPGVRDMRLSFTRKQAAGLVAYWAACG